MGLKSRGFASRGVASLADELDVVSGRFCKARSTEGTESQELAKRYLHEPEWGK